MYYSNSILHMYNGIVHLNDDNPYYLDNKCIVETVCRTHHADPQVYLPPVPKGAQLKVEEVWENLFGVWVKVLYNGIDYDLSPRSLKYIKRED